MKLKVREICVFGMLGGLMLASKLLMEALPNIHLLGTFIVAETVVYRKKALYPIYVFVLLEGLLNGFTLWWLPYLYIWTALWGAAMLLPKKMPLKWAVPVYAATAALHGLCYGTLYAPVQALVFGLSFRQMLAWIAVGLSFDVVHGLGNLACGLLICPMIGILRRLSGEE